MTYDGWRTVTVVWLDGREESIEALGRPYVADSMLHLRVTDDGDWLHIPLTAIKSWRMREYR